MDFGIQLGEMTSRFSKLFLTEEELLETENFKTYSITPFIVTLCEGTPTHIDIQGFIEHGLHIARFGFGFNLVSRRDKVLLLNMLDQAVQLICEKHNVKAWPIALCLELPSIMVHTGCIDENLGGQVHVATDSMVTLTNHTEHGNRCNSNLIYMNDYHVMDELLPGMEIALKNSYIVMIVKQRIDRKSVTCKVERSGVLMSYDCLCVRGIKFKKPSITEKDLDVISIANEFNADMLSIHSVRNSKTISQVRDLFKGNHVPLILSSICEEEGLENIDSIIQESDAIIIAREYLVHQIVDLNKMISIQLHIGGKCKQAGKPLFLSGNIMENTLTTGIVTNQDVYDVTNAVMQGAGFIMCEYKQPQYVLKALDTVHSLCIAVESLGNEDNFLRLFMELTPPVTAAEACILSCALLTKQFGSPVVVLPTTTGRTAVQLSHMAPEAVILSVTTNPVVARKLHMYKGLLPIIYSKKRQNSWLKEMRARIHLAVEFGIRKEVVMYGSTYVILRKTSSSSSYCDNLSTGVVQAQEFSKFAKPEFEYPFETDVHNRLLQHHV